MPILDSESVLNQTLAALAFSSIDMKCKVLAHGAPVWNTHEHGQEYTYRKSDRNHIVPEAPKIIF